MKRVVSGILLGILLLTTLLTGVGCGKEEEPHWVDKEMFFIGMWEKDDHNVIQLLTDGTFMLATSTSGDTGTYEIVDDTVKMTSETGPQYEYILHGDYLLSEAYEGDEISGGKLDGSYEIEHSGYGIVMEFSEDGTVTRQLYIAELMNNRIKGTYTVSDDVVTCDFLLMGTFRFVIKDGVLYDAYEYDENYRDTLAEEDSTEKDDSSDTNAEEDEQEDAE